MQVVEPMIDLSYEVAHIEWECLERWVFLGKGEQTKKRNKYQMNRKYWSQLMFPYTPYYTNKGLSCMIKCDA